MSFLNDLALIVQMHMHATMYMLGVAFAIIGTGALALRALDSLVMYLIASGPAYADLLRFLRWRFKTPNKSIDPLRLYEAAMGLYLSGRWVCNNMAPDHQTALWVALRDALRLPAGTATAKGLGAPVHGHSYQPWVKPYNSATDDDPELLLARIAYSNAQCSTDALEMRTMAADYLHRKASKLVAPPHLP